MALVEPIYQLCWKIIQNYPIGRWGALTKIKENIEPGRHCLNKHKTYINIETIK